MIYSVDRERQWSILYFGDRWDEFWRRRQQLAYRLSQSEAIKQVLYVEDYLTLTSLLKYLIRKGRHGAIERWERVISDKSFIHRVSDKLIVISPMALLPAINSRLFISFDHILRDWIAFFFLNWVLRKQRKDNWLLWVSIPWIPTSLLQRFDEMPLWYDCTEDFSTIITGFPSLIRTMCRQNDLNLIKTADVVSISARTLYEERRGWNQHIYWIPNAVDTKMFVEEEAQESPIDISHFPHPRILFVGAINHQRDWRLVEYLASLHSGWTFVILGPIQDRDIASRFDNTPNVQFLGPRPYHKLPAYLQHCDACLEFYKPSRLSKSGQSLKIPLYLAAGKPVVATPSDGAEYFRNVLEIARTPEEFSQKLTTVLSNDSDTLRQKRKNAVMKDSWDMRSRQVLDILEKHFVVG